MAPISQSALGAAFSLPGQCNSQNLHAGLSFWNDWISQLDPSCLEALPADVRIELEEAYEAEQARKTAATAAAKPQVHPLILAQVGMTSLMSALNKLSHLKEADETSK